MLFLNIAILTLLLVISIVILVKRNKQITDYFLFAIIFSMALYVAADAWVLYELTHASFALRSIAGYLPFPPILFYSLLLTSKTHRIKSWWWLLLIFHFIYFVFIIGEIYIWNDIADIDVQILYKDPPNIYRLFYRGLHIYMIIVLIWFLRKLDRYQIKIRDYYSNLEGVDLSWLKYFLWVYISVYTTSFSLMMLLVFEVMTNLDLAFRLISVSIFIALVWMIYNGLRQYSLANFSEVVVQSDESKEKYETSSLQKEDSEKLFKNIDELFKNQKLFLNPDLKLQDVAKILESTNHKISQSINENAGVSFYTYVNNFRVEYFQTQLANPENQKFTILTLGFESGFNSKATMNRIFKKQLGETPREYLQRMHN